MVCSLSQWGPSEKGGNPPRLLFVIEMINQLVSAERILQITDLALPFQWAWFQLAGIKSLS